MQEQLLNREHVIERIWHLSIWTKNEVNCEKIGCVLALQSFRVTEEETRTN